MITSRDNQTFKTLVRLMQKKHRREQGLCIIEGEKIVREHASNAQYVFVRENSPSLTKGWRGDSRDGVVLATKLFDSVTSLETSQSILAIVPIPKPREVTFPYLVLDGIQDPGNMGTILRTAAAFGFNTVFCVNCADVWSQKVLRAGVGTQFHLNVIEGFGAIPEESELYIADLNGAWLDKPSGKFGLVLGNEGQGVSAAIKALPHKVVTIPMTNATESLNVAVAGGILMHAMTK